MKNLIKSKKYVGVYFREKQDGDITYYFTYRDGSKTVFQKVGTKTEGVTERYTFDKRNETVIELRNGEVPQIQRNSKKYEIKFKEIAEFYFDNRKVRSIERRRKLYKHRLEYEFGNMNLFKITPKHILDFRNQYIDKLKPHTINLYVELISTIFNYYSKNHNIRLSNPTHNVDKLQVSNTRNRILTKNEIEVLFEVLEDDFMLSLFCSLSLCTGARKSTVLNYSIKDLNLEHKTLNSYDFKNQTSYVSFIDDRTYELLQHRLNSVYDIDPNRPLVYIDNIKDLTRLINRKLKVIFDELFNVGLEKDDTQNRVVVHTFRHTLLSHLGMKGVSSQILQKISNHKDKSMVDRYVKLNESTGKREINDVWK